jgi:hypothetical protein
VPEQNTDGGKGKKLLIPDKNSSPQSTTSLPFTHPPNTAGHECELGADRGIRIQSRNNGQVILTIQHLSSRSSDHLREHAWEAPSHA